MRRLALTMMMVGLCAVATACDMVQEQAEQAAGSLADLTVSQIGNLASSILEDPTRAEEILHCS